MGTSKSSNTPRLPLEIQGLISSSTLSSRSPTGTGRSFPRRKKSSQRRNCNNSHNQNHHHHIRSLSLSSSSNGSSYSSRSGSERESFALYSSGTAVVVRQEGNNNTHNLGQRTITRLSRILRLPTSTTPDNNNNNNNKNSNNNNYYFNNDEYDDSPSHFSSNGMTRYYFSSPLSSPFSPRRRPSRGMTVRTRTTTLVFLIVALLVSLALISDVWLSVQFQRSDSLPSSSWKAVTTYFVNTTTAIAAANMKKSNRNQSADDERKRKKKKKETNQNKTQFTTPTTTTSAPPPPTQRPTTSKTPPSQSTAITTTSASWQDTITIGITSHITAAAAGEKGKGKGAHSITTTSATSTTTLLLPPLIANASALFRQRWCVVEESQWFPTTPDLAWQQRAPYVLVPGAKYAGGDVLARLLQQQYSFSSSSSSSSPMIVLAQPASVGQFYPDRFRAMNRADQTHVMLARARMYARDYASLRLQQHHTTTRTQTPRNSTETRGSLSSSHKRSSPAPQSLLFGMDATAGYLFYPPTRILCVMPWIKLLVVLRDPLDRVWVHYQQATSRFGKDRIGSFASWAQADWTHIQDSGLQLHVHEYNETKVDESWYQYHQSCCDREGNSGSATAAGGMGVGGIGRSLYEPALRHWLQAMRAMGRNVSQDVLVVYVEHLLAQPERVLQHIGHFLGLTDDASDPANASSSSLSSLLLLLLSETSIHPKNNPNHLNNNSNSHPTPQTMLHSLFSVHNRIPLENQTLLESLFEPYNRQLETLLKRYQVQVTTGAR